MAIRLKDKETIQVTYRQSEIILARPAILVMLALFIPWYFAVAYEMVNNFWGWLLFWTIVVAIFALYQYITWLSHSYTVTSERLICSNHNGLFRQTITEAPLANLLNVKYKTTGLLSTLFDYGNVEIQAHGLPEPIIMERVRDPEAVKDYLWELREAYTQKAGKML